MTKSEREKADLIGESFTAAASEGASFIVEEIAERFDVHLLDPSDAPQFLIEVVVLQMHLIDRLVFRYLGPYGRQAFADRFVVIVVREFMRTLSRDFSVSEFASRLKDTYNQRQRQYAEYRNLIPDENAAPKGCLFWESCKILFALLDTSNPAILMFLNTLVVDLSLELLKVLKVEEILQT